MKKTLSLVLLAVMLLSVLSFPALAENPEIVMMVSGDNNPKDDNLVLQEMEKMTGVKVKQIYIASGDYNQRLNTLVAGDTLPDIFEVREPQLALDLRDAGKLLDLTPYLQEYGQDILKDIGDDLYKMPINAGGAIYGIRNNAAGKIDNMVVRKDWLAKVGKEVPTTLDELYEVLRAFTFDDPDGNGQNDTYGLTCSMDNSQNWEHIFAAYGIAYDQNYLMEDGTVTTYMKAPNYLEAVKYFRRLYKEGILDPEFSKLSNMQTFEKLWNGVAGVYAWEAVGPTNNWYPNRYTFEVPENPEDIFAGIFLDGCTGGIKKYTSYTTPIVVSASCQDPVAAVKVLNDILFTDAGCDLRYLGVEGVMYEWIDKDNGKFQRLGIYTDDAAHRSEGAYCYFPNGCLLNNTELRTLNAFTQELQAKERERATDYAYIIQIFDAIGEYQATLKAINKEALANLIVCEDDELESLYAEYVERWNEEGGLEYEEQATAAYKAENP